MKVRPARIVDRQIVCWNCTTHLGELVTGIVRHGGFAPYASGDVVVVSVMYEIYRRAETPTLGDDTVLVIKPRVKDRLARTNLPFGRRRAAMGKGQVRAPRAAYWTAPLVLPCFRPACGEINRVDIEMTHL
jgi:hypothetical protein